MMTQYVLCEESVSNRSWTAGFHQDIGDSFNVLLSSKYGLEVSNSGKDSVCTWCHCLYFDSQVQFLLVSSLVKRGVKYLFPDRNAHHSLAEVNIRFFNL